MNTCPVCHTEITDTTSRFCPNCGASLKASSANPYATTPAATSSEDSVSKPGITSNGAEQTNGNYSQSTGGFARSNNSYAQNNNSYAQNNNGYSQNGGYNAPYQSQTPPYTGYTPYQPPVAQPSGGLAIAALVCSLLIGFVGFILGIVGLNQYPKGNSYRTMCIVAIIIPIAEFAIGIIFFVFSFLAIIGSLL